MCLPYSWFSSSVEHSCLCVCNDLFIRAGMVLAEHLTLTLSQFVMQLLGLLRVGVSSDGSGALWRGIAPLSWPPRPVQSAGLGRPLAHVASGGFL